MDTEEKLDYLIRFVEQDIETKTKQIVTELWEKTTDEERKKIVLSAINNILPRLVENRFTSGYSSSNLILLDNTIKMVIETKTKELSPAINLYIEQRVNQVLPKFVEDVIKAKITAATNTHISDVLKKMFSDIAK
jgi:hypothetical protein